MGLPRLAAGMLFVLRPSPVERNRDPQFRSTGGRMLNNLGLFNFLL